MNKEEQVRIEAFKLAKPGIYHDVPDPVYRAIPAVSQSTLKDFAKCPKSFHQGLPERETDSLNFGALFESILIYGDEGWQERYTVLSDEIKASLLQAAQERHMRKAPTKITGRMAIGRDWKKANSDEAWTDEIANELLEQARVAHEAKGPTEYSGRLPEGKAWHVEQAEQGLRVVDEIEIRCAQKAVGQFRSEPNIKRLLMYPALWQVVLVWRDPDTGLLCKAMLDWVPNGLPEGHRVLIDIKTSVAVVHRSPSAAAWKFAYSVREYGYDWQAASYSYGWKLAREQSGMERDERDGWVFAVVGNQPPWAPACYELPGDDMTAALDDYKAALQLWKRCHETDDWPGLTDDGIMMLPTLRKKS